MSRVRLPVDRSETGASLIIALAMVTLISVALVAALGFASASFNTLGVIGSQRATAYAADGAMQTAVQTMRTNTACPTVNAAAVGGQPAVAVACSVVQSATPIAPPNALWSVGNNASEVGINFAGSTALQMNAPVASNSTIAVAAGGSLSSNYSVSARSTCTGPITVTTPGVKSCGAAASYADPVYASEAAPALTSPNPAPTCTANGAILQFSPGYYSDVTDFSGAGIYTQGGNNCTSGYQYFKPGVYYFDFGFDNANGNVWNVTQNVIGGQPKGFDPSVAGSVPNPLNPGGATSVNCKTASDGATDGVQFIFGGASQMVANTNGAIVELCPDPTPANSPQQMTIVGQKTGAAAQTTALETPTAAPDPGSWTGLPTNVLPFSVGAPTIDTTVDATRYASRALGSNKSTSLLLSGYPGAAAMVLPKGSTNVGYTLNVAHQETNSSDPTDISTLTASITGCTVPALTKHTVAGSTPVAPIVTDTVALTGATCIAALQNPFSVTFTASASPARSFTENLDGIDLVVTYTPPAVRAENGCAIVINSCSVLTVGGTAKFVSWGTVYAPLASLNVNVTDTTDVVSFRRGAIARAISIPNLLAPNSTDYFCLAAGSPCTGSTGAAGARTDLLTATVTGTVKLRALVSFVDTPTPGTSLQILSWNVVR
jgi:hypothetical protein